jgi:hypothetical protein
MTRPAPTPDPVPLPDAVDGLLAHSDLIDKTLRLRLAAYRQGHEDGRRLGYDEGYSQAEMDMAAQWRPFAREVADRLTESDQARARRAVASAESYTRRAADEHWRDFVRRAFAAPPAARTLQQQVMVEECRRARGWAA